MMPSYYNSVKITDQSGEWASCNYHFNVVLFGLSWFDLICAIKSLSGDGSISFFNTNKRRNKEMKQNIRRKKEKETT